MWIHVSTRLGSIDIYLSLLTAVIPLFVNNTNPMRQHSIYGGTIPHCAIHKIRNDHTKYHRTKLASLYPKLATMVLDEENLTLALNEEYVPMGEVLKLKDGDTVALIPPISGG